jgi:phosphopantothenoylcysteine decarboxylase/phosphopantothenate--cysteine ligase
VSKKNQQFLVGSLETENEIENAKAKIQKNLDLIVLNSLQDEGAGFKTKQIKLLY